VATVAIAALVFNWGTDAMPSAIAWTAATVGLAATVFELLPLRIDDNLTIPIFVGFTTWLVATFHGVPLR
jgi:dolichol kinase